VGKLLRKRDKDEEKDALFICALLAMLPEAQGIEWNDNYLIINWKGKRQLRNTRYYPFFSITFV
jgi:hypothetical protein